MVPENSEIDGVLGGGAVESREAEPGEVSVDPCAAAAAMDAAKTDPALAAEAAAYFRKQSCLVDLQIKHFDEEHQLGIAAARRKRYADRIRNMLATLLAGAVLAIVVTVTGMIWSAANGHGLVIEAFSVPPDLAAKGLTGEVVATRFMDKLRAMQSATDSERPADSYQHNWGSELKVEIPQTGMTFGEFGRLLRDKLGQVGHLTGEVIRKPEGISITARFGDESPESFAGQESDIDELTRKAAEAIYRVSQPYRFAEFLFEHGRHTEALSVISELAANGPSSERGWAYTEWGTLNLNASADPGSATRHCLAGLSYSDASTVLAEICLVNSAVWSGHDENALEYSRKLTVHAQTHAAGTTDAYFENNKIVSSAYQASIEGDIQKSAKEFTLVESAPEYGGTVKLAPALAATAYAMNHDPDAASKSLQSSETSDDLSFLRLDALGAFQALPAFWINAAKNDWPAALADARKCDDWLETHATTEKLLGLLRPVWIKPLEALAMAKDGDVASAEALIATTPLDCYLCLRIRGQVAAIKHDWTSAERWFAEAVRQAPSLPFAFSEWGEMRLDKGDIAGAAVQFEASHHAGPHFADALKGWGDALARQGQAKAALAKYDEALQYAPDWKELKETREAVAKKKT
jgi:tetratricopeptide (TPR) repeat protein